MSAKRLPWFRLYTEIVDDDKLKLVAFEDRWHYVALLCMKGYGLLDEECSDDLKKRRIAVKMGLSVGELEMVARRLAEVELIDRDTMQPLGWDARQAPSDTSSDRVKAFRERQKAKKSGGETDETDVKRFSNGLDTDTDTEQDTEEQKQDASEAQAPAPAATGKPKAGRIAFDLPTASWSGVSDMKRRLWAEAYPAVDLHVELAKAAAWLVANPANRKSNYDAFLNRWFARAQDSAPPVRPSGSPQVKPAAVNRLPKSYGESGRL
ncbi:hypothetical protein A9J41_11440 [Laribacter hongkongensis]|uniref:hypothetical protein n=1 Tax=Laribacter hongkongensis TaxID=168471 RepID=UPI001878766F|nr:hypothetical protein [Laribacter hongkongensis]MBE5528118.1 hypothetical protein [Laribacter hongkongensis]